MYRPTIDKDAVRCSCYNTVYSQGDTSNCTLCFGTTFLGGVKEVNRVWVIFADSLNAEQLRRRGEWLPDEREIQIDSVPKLYQNDYIVRVLDWTNHIYGERFVLKTVDESSIRTGRRHDLTHDIDNIAQKARGQALSHNEPIYQYQVPPLSRNRVW